MPTYEYECASCGHEFEAFQKMTDPPKKRCPECKGKVRRKIGAGAGLIFKGSGFYITDYRSESYQKQAKAESSPPSSEKSGSSKDSGSKDAGSKDTAPKDTAPKSKGTKDAGTKPAP